MKLQVLAFLFGGGLFGATFSLMLLYIVIGPTIKVEETIQINMQETGKPLNYNFYAEKECPPSGVSYLWTCFDYNGKKIALFIPINSNSTVEARVFNREQVP